MKLLLLSQYFPPEVGAPQNRLFELALRLQKNGLQITVLTAMPNYPQMEIYPAYKGKSYLRETLGGITVHRSAIYVSKNRGIFARLRNYFSFVLSSARCASKLESQYDLLFCESPPLFLGYSAMYLARKKKAKLIFNVSDLWPESAEKLGVVSNPILLKLAYRLEAKLYRRAALVTGQTQGICDSITSRFPEVKTYWLPNGVDLQYYDPAKVQAGDWRKRHGFSEKDILVLYAGIIGIAQGLETVLRAAEQLKEHQDLKWVLLGSGPEKEKLLELKQKLGLTQVYFLEAVPKIEMPAILKSVNAAVIPLKKLELFKGAIPSKIFEALAMELPVLLAVDGEARKLFVEQGHCAFYVEPENGKDLARTLLKLKEDPEAGREMAQRGRAYVNRIFNRDNIANAFCEELKKYV